MIEVEVEFQGQLCRVPVFRAQGRLWFHWRGETHVVEVGGGTRKVGTEKTKAKPGVIVAPMPGKITRVAVQTGEQVQKGQVLVVMEAMKMEYTLQADREGEVLSLAATLGAQVALGQILVNIGEAKNG